MAGLTAKQRSHIMSCVHSKDTRIEVIFRKALWHRGIRYRKNYDRLPGKPDIAITKCKIAVFVDGDFWHARGHEEHPGEQVRSNQDYWRKHLSRNVERDRDVRDELTDLGWLVLRFWESDIRKDLEKCVLQVCEYCGKV
ncbi:very short patch repair endonuclease [uncultured Selenomonas sp.]|uniref:very short patch repair endonuclease n=1 Tax=uncultured Selenomonas sp. TaxID=159275 RepID=UPI0025F1611C|nr:very short patch repair endonuclease [uncultured Selenomonas sp.]